MAQSPNTDNYVLGKGVVYFNELVSNVYQGERDLGNAPAFSFSVAVEKLEHFSSRGGLKAKDKEVISQITPSVAFTLDEINAENIGMLSLGALSTVTQIAGVAEAEVVTANLGMRATTVYREIGSYRLAHGTVTGGPFVVGTTIVSDNASPGSGTIVAVGTGYVDVVVVSGVFANADTISVSAITADMTADPVWTAGVILVQDDADAVTYVAGTDYSVSALLKDDKIGRVLVLSTGVTILEGDELHITYNYKAVTYSQVKSFTKTTIEGFLRFVSDNPVGTQQELKIWRASLTPTGDTAMIGDDWSTLGFQGEILKDETGHPASPYMDINFL